MWEESELPELHPQRLPRRVGGPVDAVAPADTAGLCARIVTAPARRHFLEQQAGWALAAHPKARWQFGEARDVVQALFMRYAAGLRLYQWRHWLEDSARQPWLLYTYYRLIGNRSIGPLVGMAADALKGRDRVPVETATGEELDAAEFTSDDDSLSAAIHQAMPQALVATAAAVDDCAAAGLFGADGVHAAAVFWLLYGKDLTPRAVARQTGAPESFVASMAEPDWLHHKLVEQSAGRPGLLDPIIEPIALRWRPARHRDGLDPQGDRHEH